MKERKQEWDHIAEIASYYGFKSAQIPPLSKEDQNHSKNILKQQPLNRPAHKNSHGTIFDIQNKIALLRNYGKEILNMAQPVMVISRESVKKDVAEFSLDILGTSRSIAEAILIKTSLAILREEGYEDISIALNCLGDKDSIGRFEREIWNYYKKKLGDLPAKCKDCVRGDPINFDCEHEVCSAIKQDAPQPMAFLAEPTRNHFKEVLEFIETMDVPYEIDPTLYGHKDIFTHTIFEITTKAPKEEKGFVCGFGFRYSPLSRRVGYKRDVPAIGLSCAYKRIKNRIKLAKPKPAQFYFIQLGFEAKLKSLKIIETLRTWGIPILHALARDKMTGQLSSAEYMDLPFVIIMGQKEAMENSVVVRNTQTRVQEIVALDHLPKYLIHIHKSKL